MCEARVDSIFGCRVGWNFSDVGTSSRVESSRDARGEGNIATNEIKTNKQCVGFIYYIQRKSTVPSEWRYSYNDECDVKQTIQCNPIQSTTDEIFTRDDALNGVIAVDDDEMSKRLGEEDVVRSTRGKV